MLTTQFMLIILRARINLPEQRLFKSELGRILTFDIKEYRLAFNLIVIRWDSIPNLTTIIPTCCFLHALKN